MNDTTKGAFISECGRYRYKLWRVWNASLPQIVYVMLNPSTADANVDDATIRVCCGRAQRLGFGGIEVLNLFAWRATEPGVLLGMSYGEAVGPANADHLITAAQSRRTIIAAWGDHPAIQRGVPAHWRLIAGMFREHGNVLQAIRTTKSGQPCHPLRLPYSEALKPWTKVN